MVNISTQKEFEKILGDDENIQTEELSKKNDDKEI